MLKREKNRGGEKRPSNRGHREKKRKPSSGDHREEVKDENRWRRLATSPSIQKKKEKKKKTCSYIALASTHALANTHAATASSVPYSRPQILYPATDSYLDPMLCTLAFDPAGFAP